MTTSPPPEPLDLVGLDQAFLRASWNAQRIAAQTGTKLAIWRDGKVALIDPDSITLPMPAELRPKVKPIGDVRQSAVSARGHSPWPKVGHSVPDMAWWEHSETKFLWP